MDNYGNVLNVDSQLKELIKESIVVQKFVYDDDDVQVQEEIPKPKGKSKKTKS
jgi:hypothetical protein